MHKRLIAICAFLAFAFPAVADQNIGSAGSIEKDVQGAAGGRVAKLKSGDAIFFDEVITTGAGSRGRFNFSDATNLQMGPSSRVKLDNFVYAGGGAGVGFNAAKGAFRFISNRGPHQEYEVRTPTATIGVRGTVFGVRATGGQTDAVLYSGVIEVCPTNGGECRTLDTPCTFVTVTANGASQIKKVGRNDWSFDKACKGAPPIEQGSVTPPSSPPPPPGIPPEFAINPGVGGALLGAAIIGGGVAAGVTTSSGAGSCTNRLVPVSGGSVAICN